MKRNASSFLLIGAVSVGAFVMWLWSRGPHTGVEVQRGIEVHRTAGAVDVLGDAQRPGADGGHRHQPTGDSTAAEEGPAEACTVAVQVRTRALTPIALASVSIFQGGELLVQGETNDRGESILIPGGSTAPIDLAVASPGFATEWMHLRCPTPGLLPVVLVPSGAISGHVYTNGLPAEGASVLAMPRTYFQAGPTPSVSVPTATTDPDGYFLFDDIRPGVEYAVHAGARGAISEPVVGVYAQSDALELHLLRVFAAKIKWREPGGVRPKWPLPSTALRVEPNAPAGSIRVSSDLLGLAGVPAAILERADGFDKLLACASSSSETKLGPIHVTLEAPRYEPSQTEIWLAAMDLGDIPVTSATLVPRKEMGCVQVRPLGLLKRAEVEMVWPLFVVGLVGESGDRIEIPVLHMAHSNDACGVPVGEYKAYIASTYSGYARTLPGTVVVRGEVETRIDLDLGDLGLVSLEVESPEGMPYTGLLTLEVWSESSQEGERGTVNYSAAPYHLLLPRGLYSVEVGLPGFLVEAGEYSALGFESHPGEVHTLLLSK